MILTVDFNPILIRKYLFESIDIDDVNIPEKVEYGAGGEGTEMSCLLNALNEEVKVIGYLGGINGTYIHYNLSKLQILNSFVPIKDETPETIILSYKDKEFIINSKEPRVTREELEKFYELYSKTVDQAEIICLMGKIPSSVPKEIVYDFVERANKYNHKVFIQLKGDELKYTLGSRASYLLIDREDLEDITKLRLTTSGEIVKASRYIMDRGIEKLVINLDERGSLLITQDSYYIVRILDKGKEFKTNSSYMLGGYVYALSRGYDLETAAKLGQACGIGSSYIDSEVKDMGDIKYIMNKIEVKKYDY